MVASYPGFSSAKARDAGNCRNVEVVEAARKREHDVSAVVCQQCPFRAQCRTSGYYSQFAAPGPLVGTVEMLFSTSFLRGGDLVVLDDPSLDRALIDTRKVTSKHALELASTAPAGPVRELLTIVQRAIDALHADREFAPPLIGPAAWDALADAAGSAARLVELVRAAPDVADVLPTPADGDALTVEDIERAPPAVLARLLRLLKDEDEVDAFARHQEFNSGLSLHPGGLEIRTARTMLADQKTGRPLLQDKAVLVLDAVLDATPLMPLYEHLARGLVLEPTFAPVVALPPNVAVTQVADSFYGKTSLERRHGAEGRRSARDALLVSLATQRGRYPGDREAAIAPKSLRDDVIAAGIAPERVLTYHANRGLNTIEDADVLHVLGRPQAPNYAALQLAHVLHKGETPISPHMTMRSESYAGYRAADGTGRAIDVLDFEDPRASALFRAYREAELVQSIHRARLLRVGDPQIGMFESVGQSVARMATDRRRVRLVIHSAHPIPGLRVDELLYGEAGLKNVGNESRAIEAAERILAACTQLVADGVPVTVNAVARATGSNKKTISQVLARAEFDPPGSHPLACDLTR